MINIDVAKKKNCPLGNSGQYGVNCETYNCMWWIDRGKLGNEYFGECAVTTIVQSLCDIKLELNRRQDEG